MLSISNRDIKMQNIDTSRLVIIRQYGRISGLKSQTKNIYNFVKSKIKIAEDNFDENEIEARQALHFEDCGDFYEGLIRRAEGKVEGLTSLLEDLHEINDRIREERQFLRELESDFKNEYGTEEFEILQFLIESTALATRQTQVNAHKQKNQVNKSAKNILNIILSLNTEHKIGLVGHLNGSAINMIKTTQDEYDKKQTNSDETRNIILNGMVDDIFDRIMIIANNINNLNGKENLTEKDKEHISIIRKNLTNILNNKG